MTNSSGKVGQGHTPGPWKGSLGTGIRTQAGLLIADIHKHLDINLSAHEQEANAALIAAAPGLLEACKKALEACKQTMCPNGLYFKDEWPQAFEGLEKAISTSEMEQ